MQLLSQDPEFLSFTGLKVSRLSFSAQLSPRIRSRDLMGQAFDPVHTGIPRILMTFGYAGLPSFTPIVTNL